MKPETRPSTPGDTAMASLRGALLAWFDANLRDLPWRRTRDPYAVWISEIMLQQTRVDTVIPYYRRWMERFPDPTALANAELDDVLGVWKGLGYYARARNAHRAARTIADVHGGSLPRSSALLRELPGVGDYTAGAVASISFGEPVPAVDGNVRRVYARLFDWPDPPAARLRDLAADLVDATRPGDFNQAAMELGALVCTPQRPACDMCPLEEMCMARAAGTVLERPIKKARPPLPKREWVVLVAVSPEGRVLLVRRPTEGLLGGLWEFPATPGGPHGADGPGHALERVVRGAFSTSPEVLPLPPVIHRFSHFEATYRPYVISVLREWGEDGGRWAAPADLDVMALPVAQQEIARSALAVLG